MSEETLAELESCRLFDAGYYCAESVLAGVAAARGVQSPLIPAIATGLCSGLARSSGLCGALGGGVLALGLAHGRSQPGQSVETNYRAVRELLAAFAEQHGATGCSELLGCDLGSEAGQRQFREQGLIRRCRAYVGTAARLTGRLCETAQGGDAP